MSKAAFSTKVFAVYLFVLGAALVLTPNFLLGLFGIAPTAEVWIRMVGVLVLMIGVQLYIAARHQAIPLLQASVLTRRAVFVLLTAFALTGIGSPMLILFGVIDLCGGLWTHFALEANGRTRVARSASQG